ncbi:MAG: hypothetical protein WCO52_00285 [bacterium]
MLSFETQAFAAPPAVVEAPPPIVVETKRDLPDMPSATVGTSGGDAGYAFEAKTPDAAAESVPAPAAAVDDVWGRLPGGIKKVDSAELGALADQEAKKDLAGLPTIDVRQPAEAAQAPVEAAAVTPPASEFKLAPLETLPAAGQPASEFKLASVEPLPAMPRPTTEVPPTEQTTTIRPAVEAAPQVSPEQVAVATPEAQAGQNQPPLTAEASAVRPEASLSERFTTIKQELTTLGKDAASAAVQNAISVLRDKTIGRLEGLAGTVKNHDTVKAIVELNNRVARAELAVREIMSGRDKMKGEIADSSKPLSETLKDPAAETPVPAAERPASKSPENAVVTPERLQQEVAAAKAERIKSPESLERGTGWNDSKQMLRIASFLEKEGMSDALEGVLAAKHGPEIAAQMMDYHDLVKAGVESGDLSEEDVEMLLAGEFDRLTSGNEGEEESGAEGGTEGAEGEQAASGVGQEQGVATTGTRSAERRPRRERSRTPENRELPKGKTEAEYANMDLSSLSQATVKEQARLSELLQSEQGLSTVTTHNQVGRQYDTRYDYPEGAGKAQIKQALKMRSNESRMFNLMAGTESLENENKADAFTRAATAEFESDGLDVTVSADPELKSFQNAKVKMIQEGGAIRVEIRQPDSGAESYVGSMDIKTSFDKNI